MPNVYIKKNAELSIQEIDKMIKNSNEIRRILEQEDVGFSELESLRSEVRVGLDQIFTSSSESKNYMNESKIFINKLSTADNKYKIMESLKRGTDYLEGLRAAVESGIYLPGKSMYDLIDKTMAIIVIRRILQNFYKHIKAMYQDEVHGNGTIRKENLDCIQIGNEYDVQRILYSLINPIFPNARLEVVGDTGYNSVRYDITLDEYEIIIEVKCTRPSMTERSLREELGADSFHYKADHLFLFIFDKVGLIKNPEAFAKSFKREKQDFDKELEAIIIQDIIL